MTLQQIAQQVSTEYDLPIDELRIKEYCGDPHWSMKIDFVVKARHEGFSNSEIADFMDYSYTSVSDLYNAGMVGKDKFKYEKVLTLMQQDKAVSEEEFTGIRDHVKRLKEKGHHIFKSQNGYKLA